MPDEPVTAAEEAVIERRSLLGTLGYVAAAVAVVGVPIVGYLLSPLLNPARNVWRTVGRVDQFRIGETTTVTFEDPSPLAWAGQTAQAAAWLRRTGEQTFTAFAVNCTHLGCPVSWLAEAQLFMCPCHGGVYYGDGRVAGGPPPRPLFQYEVRVQGQDVQLLTAPFRTG
ncbi:MAG TPA: Rieske (2Fe-2S) protein [Chloroflexota bacterium]|jgi:menaquinol-cytochrome c reductase iron-sulfur subunit|nr:Rieske (2Fe-2S) protein [Chloroflexota bacterium]